MYSDTRGRRSPFTAHSDPGLLAPRVPLSASPRTPGCAAVSYLGSRCILRSTWLKGWYNIYLHDYVACPELCPSLYQAPGSTRACVPVCQLGMPSCADPVGHWLGATTVITHIPEREGGVFWAEVPGMCHASVSHLLLSGPVRGHREAERLLPSGQGVSPADRGVQGAAHTRAVGV